MRTKWALWVEKERGGSTQLTSNFQSLYFMLTKQVLSCLTVLLLGSGCQVFATPIAPHSNSKTPTTLAQKTAPSKADDLLEQGNQRLNRGELQEALPLYQQALDEYRQRGEQTGTGLAQTNLGVTYYQLGHYQKALDSLQAAMTTHRSVLENIDQSSVEQAASQIFTNRGGLRVAARTIGLVYTQLGQYDKALDFYQQAFAQGYGRTVGDSDCAWDATVLNDVGQVYFKQGRDKEALKFYQHGLKIIDNIGYASGGKLPHEREAFVCFGNYYKNILASFPKPIDDKLPNDYDPIRLHPWARSLLLTTFNNIAEIYNLRGPRSTAVQFYLKSLQTSRSLDDRTLEARSLNNLGISYAAQGRFADATDFYQDALKLSQTLGDRALEGQILHDMGKALFNANQPKEASDRFSAAVNIWESLRPGLADINQVSLFETQLETYRLLQQALISQRRPEEALEIAERGRTRAFVELLAKRLSSRTIDPSITKSLTLPQIQQIAKNQNATLVQYSIITDETIYAWVVKPTGEIYFHQINFKSALQKQRLSLAEYIETVRSNGIGVRGRGKVENLNRQNPDPSPDLKQLHQLLIQPIANSLPTNPSDRVIVIPQGTLFLVPFAALQDPSGKYLIEKHTLITAPSIQVLALTRSLQSNQAPSNANPLIVGNPTMPRVTLEAGFPPEQLLSLPGAEQEAKAIAQLLKTQPLIGNAATETTVVQQMQQARLVHLATHGMLDDFRGLGVPGALALAPSGQDDGLLTASEILDLRLNADLVVLSACDTGRGKITGDGVIGLSRSLISAGVPSVIVSLWAVPDAPTASLMTEFYQNLNQNPDKAQALRQAMLSTLKKYPEPSNWAAFTLIGEAN